MSYVTEDTTRSRPDVLTTLFRRRSTTARRASCLSDTVGHATPDGVRNLMQFTRSVIAGTGAKVGIDWHGHNDRGLALDNALWALEHGADRVHGDGARHRRARRQPADGAPAPQPAPPRPAPARARPDEARRVLRDRGACGRLGHPAQLSARRPRRVPHRHGRARRGHHQGRCRRATRGSPTAIYSGVPAGTFGRQQEIAHRLHERRVERELLAPAARNRADREPRRRDSRGREDARATC